jgi:hypothetical protein
MEPEPREHVLREHSADGSHPSVGLVGREDFWARRPPILSKTKG